MALPPTTERANDVCGFVAPPFTEDRMTATAPSPVALLYHFADLDDPRSNHTKRHGLLDLIALTLCAVVSGADAWTDVETYGVHKCDWLETFLELPNGIPSHDTLGRVFAALDPAAFQQCFLSWMHAVVGASRGKLVAIDGKALRYSFDTAKGKSALHLVSAWASANHLLLGQQAVADKSNEITAIPELLRLLDLQGALVTIDAMGCQKQIAADIVAGGGDYVLAVKENQPALYTDVQRLFLDGLEDDFAGLEHRSARTIEQGHGRSEERHYHIVAVPEHLAAKHAEFAGLRSLGMVFSERQVGDGPLACETRFYISSLPAEVKAFARAVRGHWGIENGLHWVLDMAFGEDASRVRKDHGPENLAWLRRVALSLLWNEPSADSVKCKRKMAGWDNDYLLQVLLGNSGGS
jgi:predicted transposase YbfD/YdcC